MKKVLFLVLTVFFLINCSNDDENPFELKIRLSNVSQYDYENIVVNTSSGDVSFENLMSGQKSTFKVFQKAYRYAFIELQIDGKTFTIQPIDYVGETPLTNGNYTYQINANDSQEQYGKLSLVLIEE